MKHNISPGTVSVAVLAILFGLVTAYAVSRYLRPEEVTEEEKKKAETVRVLAAKVNLPKYHRIRIPDLIWLEIPRKNLKDGRPPQGTVKYYEQVLGLMLKETVMARRPIMVKSLYGPGEVPSMAENLRPGYRAVTFQVKASSAVNGIVQPESYVDVNLTVSAQEPELKGLATLTLLRGVKVLATSTVQFPRIEDRPTNVRNITVEVLPKQANKLILAQRYGTLSVTLRNKEDVLAGGDEEDRELISTNDLLGLVARVKPASVERKVQVWRGGSMKEVVFGKAEIEEAERATAADEEREPIPAPPGDSPPSEPAPKDSAGDDTPTLAPPQDSPVLPAEIHIERQPSGQVIYIPVEAGELSTKKQAQSNEI